jgi:hypothetical protein
MSVSGWPLPDDRKRSGRVNKRVSGARKDVEARGETFDVSQRVALA